MAEFRVTMSHPAMRIPTGAMGGVDSSSRSVVVVAVAESVDGGCGARRARAVVAVINAAALVVGGG
jgi:hypothetical protein